MNKGKVAVIAMLSTVLAVVLLWQGGDLTGDNTGQQTGFSDGYVEIAGQRVHFVLADSPDEQMMGLSGYSALEQNQGMLFVFDEPHFPSFWMKDMKFDIDIIWINGDTVMDITHDAEHLGGTDSSHAVTYTPRMPVNLVLEVSAGWAREHGLEPGQTVEIVWPPR